ncbi:hypothetical protein PF005_g10555 [Phytophthora fragariae]|uniref:Uncharacterized protein n=1 Tax=Phytophthora fragariae TaxID=53985 RepID=A0A6A3Y5G9_9STRA|nr:hypothetical protein PF005_g10555 [Phytophthora fragariae]KAE9233476.1 hypothetical protein PF002_g12070 [Phytophthora fragariae]
MRKPSAAAHKQSCCSLSLLLTDAYVTERLVTNSCSCVAAQRPVLATHVANRAGAQQKLSMCNVQYLRLQLAGPT